MKTSGNRIEDPDMNPYSYAHLIFDKVTKNIRKESLFKKCCWKSGYLPAEKLKLYPCLSPYTSINSKWIKELNIRTKTLQLGKSREYPGSNRYKQG
jgi:hypothetical protein